MTNGAPNKRSPVFYWVKVPVVVRLPDLCGTAKLVDTFCSAKNRPSKKRSERKSTIVSIRWCFLSYCNCVGVDTIDHSFDADPQSQIREDLHNATMIGEGCVLKDGHIFQ